VLTVLDLLLGPLLVVTPWPRLEAVALDTSPPPDLVGPASFTQACPGDMVRVQGVHHEHVQRVCTEKRWGKCVAFEPELVLVEAAHTPVDVCMDRYEWPNRPRQEPTVMVTFGEAERHCNGIGKRLCTEFEWELACEGPEHLPWPYGWQRREGTCNSDRPYRGFDAAKLSSDDPQVRARELARLWQGTPSGAFPRCESPFGAVDLVGNVEEWVRTSRSEWPRPSSLKGGYWSKPWTGCRGTNEQHGGSFRFYQVGFRCCREPS
jgi:formylglycine-generating enzyme required for sulfatase activity